MIEYIKAALLIIAAILTIIAAIGLISLSNNTKNKVYARIHIAGLFDVACIIAMIGLGQYLLAGIYFILAPFIAHAIANAYWKKEDRENNGDLMTVEEEVDENHPFIHPKEKMQALESENSEKLKAATLSIYIVASYSTIESYLLFFPRIPLSSGYCIPLEKLVHPENVLRKPRNLIGEQLEREPFRLPFARNPLFYSNLSSTWLISFIILTNVSSSIQPRREDTKVQIPLQ